jgi:hypothetical protein
MCLYRAISRTCVKTWILFFLHSGFGSPLIVINFFKTFVIRFEQCDPHTPLLPLVPLAGSCVGHQSILAQGSHAQLVFVRPLYVNGKMQGLPGSGPPTVVHTPEINAVQYCVQSHVQNTWVDIICVQGVLFWRLYLYMFLPLNRQRSCCPMAWKTYLTLPHLYWIFGNVQWHMTWIDINWHEWK